ncbi:MAG: sigma 54-interacting transcriptional regulator [Calditrichia bacterium]
MARIIAVDDDPNFLNSVANLLQYKKYEVEVFLSPLDAIERFKNNTYDCALLDVKMPQMDGLQLLRTFGEISPTTPVIMVSGESTIEIAVQAIKDGAFDFIEKPLDADRLLVCIRNALEKNSLLNERELLIEKLGETVQMVGNNPRFLKVVSQSKVVAPSKATVLITGESGTGKELIARTIHLFSKRNTRPYVKVNCAAIPTELLESVLFGHKRGAFTGAISDQKGKFLVADGGTLFLDEIGDIHPNLQAKLLNALQDGEIEVIGQNSPTRVDVRIIAATNRDLPQMVEEGKFREDLYHRLNVIHLHLPPLRERLDDIPLLAEHFLHQYAEGNNKRLVGFTPQAFHVLQQHHWPGNVRELANLITQVAVFSHAPVIDAEQITEALKTLNGALPPIPEKFMHLEEAKENFEKEYIRKALQMSGGKVSQAAELLGVNRSSLYKKLQKLKLL